MINKIYIQSINMIGRERGEREREREERYQKLGLARKERVKLRICNGKINQVQIVLDLS